MTCDLCMVTVVLSSFMTHSLFFCGFTGDAYDDVVLVLVVHFDTLGYNLNFRG